MLTLENKMINKKRFYVFGVVSNPVRYSRRWELFKQWQRHMHDVEANTLSLEIAYGKRFPQVIQPGEDDYKHPSTMLFRSHEELWHKENMINLGIQYLTQIDPKWEYVAWVDADVHFQRHDIIEETAHQLQHYDIVQMFSHAIDMDPEMQPLRIHNGFMWSYFQNNFEPPIGPGFGGYYGAGRKAFWHPGYAWAARRSALDKIQLLDKAILGAGDHHMALALIGQAQKSVPAGISPGYRNMVMEWQEQAEFAIRRNVGYVPGTITHYWHGSKKSRKYIERWQVLIANQFDPTKDISREPTGLYRLNPNHGMRSIRLRDQIRAYFRQRNEDCIYTGNDITP
jgi:hypothetical protein